MIVTPGRKGRGEGIGFRSVVLRMHLSLQYGWTPLMWASCNGRMDCVKLLLDRGAELNVQNKVSEILSSSFPVGTVLAHTCILHNKE